MKQLARFFVIGMLVVLTSGLFSASVLADDTLLEGTEFSKQYLVQLSGTVLNETFSGAQALLTLMAPVPGTFNPYQLIIDGFPQKNSRNSFFWNSNNSDMTAIANDITCEIKRTLAKPVPMYFVFLSPELLRHTGAALDGKKQAEKVALPTLITATAGKLKVRIYSNSVSGTIWMTGYDPIEKSYVQYNARLDGRKTYKMVPRQGVRK